MKLPLDKLRLPRRRAADAAGGAPASAGKKGKRKKLKKPVMIAAAVVLVGGAAAAYHLTAGAKADEVQTYIEAEATRQDIQKTLSATGTIQPANQYNVTSSVQGDVLSCTFEEGDTVKKGDTLYEIDKTDAQNQIDQAKLQLEQSRNSYNQTAESLNDLTVTSKKSGMITELYVEVGDEVQAGAKIADVRDSSVMELRVPFNSADVSKFGVGSTATVTMDSSFETLTGSVTSIDAQETVLDGYQIVKYVTIRVNNPGGLSISEGSRVSVGSVIAKLSSTSTENQITNSRLSLEQQQLSYQNTVEKLDDYTITAPIDGTIITRNIKVGDTLDATNGQTTLAVIYDMSYLTFDISLDELDVNEVAVGQTVNITCDSLTDAGTFEGTVTKVSVAGTTSNGVTTYPVTVRIDSAPDGLLPGMNVDATIVVEESKDALTVPVAAVQRGNTVYVKDDSAKNTDSTMVGGTVLPDGWREATVETGLSDDSNIEITSGLSEGDTVYVPQVQAQSSSDDQMMPGGDMGGMPGGDMGGAPGGGGGGMPGGGGGGAPGGGGGGGMP